MLYKKIFKRLIDILFSFFFLLVFIPVFLLLIFVLFFVNKGNPFFFQTRAGKDGDLFKIMKFKTMNDKRDKNGELLSDEERLSKIGKVIRKTSLDETPQLFNVLKGDMSLIGPRPLLREYLPLYNTEQSRRHEVSPGITGWAQVNGRNAISWQKKFELDVYYVDHISFLLDVKIFLLTIKSVFEHKGISSDTSVSMERFIGNF